MEATSEDFDPANAQRAKGRIRLHSTEDNYSPKERGETCLIGGLGRVAVCLSSLSDYGRVGKAESWDVSSLVKSYHPIVSKSRAALLE
jgi:hypothetical protein